MKNTRITKILALLFVCVLAMLTVVVVAACDGTKATITLNYETLELYVNGKDNTVRATLEPADNTATYEWSIDDESVASIKPTQSICKVSPLKEGTATLTVTAGGATATCAITVGPDQHVQLSAPSFTYDANTGIITITDPNTTGVGSYRLDFYPVGSDELAGSVTVKNGEAVDTMRIGKGTYTVKLVAVGASELFVDSEPSTTTATITVDKDALYNLGVGDAGALERENNWAYYKYDWVIVDPEEAYCYDGVVHFMFSNNTADATTYQWITQLIYNYGKTQEGKLYKMVLNINTTSEGRVTLGDKAVTLHEGDNLVTVCIDGSKDGGLFKIQFGVSGEYNSMKEATINLSIVGEIEETELIQLEIPESFTYNQSTNVITIKDDVNSEYDANYVLGFFDSESAASPKGTTKVVSGGEVDQTSVGTGIYYLRLMAATTGKPYTSSDWSDVMGTINVTNSVVPVPNGGQAESEKNPNKWYEWHSTSGQQMPNTTIDEIYVDDLNNVHLTFHVAEGSITNQPVKLHYNDSAINKGDVYTFTCKIHSEVEGYITVNGQVFEISVGDNDISVTRAQPDKTNGGGMRTTITIQFGAQIDGNDYMVEGSFVVSEVKLTKVDVSALETPMFTYDSATGKVTITDTANSPEKVLGYQIGFFESETATDPIDVAIIDADGMFDSSAIGSGTYYLRVRALPADVIYLASDWSAVGGTVGVVTERVDISSGTLGGAKDNQNKWFYYKESSTTIGEDGVYLDENNDIHVSYQADSSYNSDQPIKLFFNKSDINQGDEYTLTFVFVSPVAGYITVNGKVKAIEVGENTISVTRAQPDKGGSDGHRATIVIVFGAIVDGSKVHIAGGEFLIKNIELTPVVSNEDDAATAGYSMDAILVNDGKQD